MKTQIIKHCMSADIEYEFPEFPSETMNGEDYEQVKGLLKDGAISGELWHGDIGGRWRLKSIHND